MNALEHKIGLVLRGAAVALLVGILVLMVANVINRFLNVVSLDWNDEIIELMLVWMVFLGSAEVWRLNQHFAVDFVPAMCHGTRLDKPFRVVIALGCLVFIAIFTSRSFDLFERATDVSPYFSLPRKLWYGAMPATGALMTLFSLRQFFEILRTPAQDFMARKREQDAAEELAEKVSTAL